MDFTLIFIYCQLRARRALPLLNDVLLRTRRALWLYKVYGKAPFWFSMEHHWLMITPFWLSTADICFVCFAVSPFATVSQAELFVSAICMHYSPLYEFFPYSVLGIPLTIFIGQTFTPLSLKIIFFSNGILNLIVICDLRFCPSNNGLAGFLLHKCSFMIFGRTVHIVYEFFAWNSTNDIHWMNLFNTEPQTPIVFQ